MAKGPAAFGEVVARYIFNSPTHWTLEITLILAALHYLFAGPQTSALEAHIAVTAVTDKLPAKTRSVLQQFGRIVAFGCCAVLAWASYNQALFSWDLNERSGTTFNTPMPIILKAALLAVAILMGLQAVASFVRRRGEP